MRWALFYFLCFCLSLSASIQALAAAIPISPSANTGSTIPENVLHRAYKRSIPTWALTFTTILSVVGAIILVIALFVIFVMIRRHAIYKGDANPPAGAVKVLRKPVREDNVESEVKESTMVRSVEGVKPGSAGSGSSQDTRMVKVSMPIGRGIPESMGWGRQANSPSRLFFGGEGFSSRTSFVTNAPSFPPTSYAPSYSSRSHFRSQSRSPVRSHAESPTSDFYPNTPERSTPTSQFETIGDRRFMTFVPRRWSQNTQWTQSTGTAP